MRANQLAPLVTWLGFAAGGLCAVPDAASIIERSAAANQKDGTAAPAYSFQETERNSHGSKTFRVVVIDGSPYQTFLSVNGRELTSREIEKQHASLKPRSKILFLIGHDTQANETYSNYLSHVSP